MFEEGKEKTGGRQKGTPNKLTQTVKDTVLNVFIELEESGEGLLAFARKHPRDFYQIAAKLIPTEVNANVQTKIITVITPKEDETTQDGSQS